jgi:lipopolysaccharide/colanic/teichoic acid biosynthesis glycosyltransferase
MHRAFSVVCAAAGLVLLSPLLVAIAVAIKWDDGGPVFYSQRRVGQGFRVFLLLKFRSMVVNADKAALLTSPQDSRLTRIGLFLRKYKLDELPQLWNVCRGDMQLVGSRPEVERYVEMFRDQYASLLNQLPGITDPASLAYRCEDKIFIVGSVEQQYVSKILPDKLRLSLEYQRRRTFLSDLRVLVSTVLGLTA